MLQFFVKKWLIGQKQRDYEREALHHEFQASEIYLDIRNSKGLIDFEKEDIKANEADIKQDEFEIEKCKKATDKELEQIWVDSELENGRSPMDVTVLPPIEQLRKENNEYIQKMQAEVKNLKAGNQAALERIKQHEMDLRGVREEGSGRIIKQGHNTRYQGHMAAAQKARIHAQELSKFLKRTHKNKIKLADE